MPSPNTQQRYYPDPVESSVFQDAPAGAEFRTIITRFEGQTLDSVIFPELEEAAKLLVKSCYTEVGILAPEQQIDDPQLNFERHLVIQRHRLYPDRLVIPVATACLLSASVNHRLPTSNIKPAWPRKLGDLIFTNAIEPGRLASSHPSKIVRRLGFLALVRSAIGYISGASIPLLLFHTEQPHIRTLEEFGLPLVKADPVLVQEARPQPTQLIPAFLEYTALLEAISSNPKSNIAKFFDGLNHHLGLDWYDSNMMPIPQEGDQPPTLSYPFPFN